MDSAKRIASRIMNRKKSLTLVGIILTLIAGLVSGLDMIGEKATLARILIVFFSGMGGGVGLMKFIRSKKE